MCNSKMATKSTSASNTNQQPVQKYGQIVLTLDNVLLPSEKLDQSPSSVDGLDKDTEYDLRVVGCELIQLSGILLRLPQVAMACGQVLFQRMYYAKSLVRYPMEATAMACIALASKIEEAPRKIRDVISVFRHIRQLRNSKPITPVILDANYVALKNQVIKAERRVLKELGFCCHVKHPHKMIIMYLRFLEADDNRSLAKSSWNYMNDALRTDVLLKFSPEAVAASCIWLAARVLKVPLPENPPWYHVLNADIDDIHIISAAILKLYTRPKVKLETLETRVEEIRKQQQEARLKNKLQPTAQQTPAQQAGNNFSPAAASRNNSPGGKGRRHQSRNHREERNNKEESGAKRSNSRSSNSDDSGKTRKKARRSDSRDRSRSRSNERDNRRHHHRSRSRSRSREHNSRDHYSRNHSKSGSKSSSPTVTPPPRFIKNKDKGSIVKSVSRSRSRSPIRTYEKYERQEKLPRKEKYDNHDKGNKYAASDKIGHDKAKYYDGYDYKEYKKSDVVKHENNEKRLKHDKYGRLEKMDKYEKIEKYEKTDKYERADKYSKLDKYEKYVGKHEKKVDNGYDRYEKLPKSKKSRHGSRSRDRRRN